MMAFDPVFPEIANREHFKFTLENNSKLPDGTYTFRELYCNRPDCDCRRVLLHVFRGKSKQHMASISYAFDRHGDPSGQLYLDPLNPQSEYAPILLKMFKNKIKNKPKYKKLLIRHYKLFREAVEDTTHPLHEKTDPPKTNKSVFNSGPRKPYIRSTTKIGLNAPCPCGSGRKYKKCCKRKKG